MTATFIPIDQIWSAGGALIAVGSAPIAGLDGSPEPEALQLAEMASGQFAGVVEIIVAGGQVQLIARVVEPVAAEKCRRSVYSGFGLTVLQAADGSQRIRRIALIDSPSAIGKAGAQRALAAAKRSILCDEDVVSLLIRQERDRASESRRIAKAQGAAAAALNPDDVVGSIKRALAQPFRENSGVISFLKQRRAA